MSVELRNCRTCGVEQPLLTCFSKNKCHSSGYDTQCKACYSAYYYANRDNIRERVREYAAARPQEMKAYHAEYYLKNKERLIAQQRDYECRNREAVNERHREWSRRDREKNPEKWRIRSSKYPEANREHSHRRRARKLATTVADLTPALLAAKLDYYGGKCWMCGEDACEWDHVKPLSKGGSHILANLRPACRSCNAQKQAKWPVPTSLRAA